MRGDEDTLRCWDCGVDEPVEEDPRDPPLDRGQCLCPDCAVGAWVDVRDEAETRLCEADENLKRLGHQDRPWTIGTDILWAWVVDRSVQYDRGSDIRAALEDLAESVRKREHIDAATSGELDDLLKRLRARLFLSTSTEPGRRA